MAKCLTCGTDNPDDNVYCAKCGTQLAGAVKIAGAAAYEDAQKQFEKDALIGIDKDKLVYTCTLCGAVNRIENEVCGKCGKKRPRNEFVTSLRRMQEGRAAKEEFDAQQKADAEAEIKPKVEEALKAPVPEDPQPEKKLALFKYVEEPRQQLPQTVQPFVIVPYVNTNQPLWQAQPPQVFRFQPATYEERMAAEHRALAAQNGEPATREECLRLKSKVEAQLKALDEANPARVNYCINKKRVRICAAFSLIVAVAALIVFFVSALSASFADLKGVGFVKALGVCLRASGIGSGFGDSSYAYQGAVSYIVPACAIIVFLCVLAILIRSIVRLFTGRAAVKGFILPLVAFVIALAGGITLISVSGFGFNNIAGFFGDVQIGFYSMLAAPLILFIIGICCPQNRRLGN